MVLIHVIQRSELEANGQQSEPALVEHVLHSDVRVGSLGHHLEAAAKLVDVHVAPLKYGILQLSVTSFILALRILIRFLIIGFIF